MCLVSAWFYWKQGDGTSTLLNSFINIMGVNLCGLMVDQCSLVCELVWMKDPKSFLHSPLQSGSQVIVVVFATSLIWLLGPFVRDIVLLHS